VIRIVVGPPAAGKTTLVSRRRAEGDVVIDFDAIAYAFGATKDHESSESVRSVAFAARTAAIARAFDGVADDTWVIAAFPAKAQIDNWGEGGAKFVIVDPGKDEVLKRAKAEGRPAGTEELIEKWYADRPAIPEKWLDGGRKAGAMRVKNVAIQVKTEGLKEGQFLVYPSTFTKTPDSYGDIVNPHAFDDTIDEWKDSGNVLPGLYGHRLDDPDFFVAEAIDQGVDEHGWWVKGQFDLESPKGAQVYRLVKGKRLSQLSFAFDVLDEGTVELEDGTKANELRKLKVYEFSFVPVGANQDTSVVAVKSAVDALTADVKSGRALSAKNEQTLRDVAGQLADAAAAVKTVLEQVEGDDRAKASGQAVANDEEPQRAKSEEPSVNPSVEALSLTEMMMLSATLSGKEDQQ
jgi:HK97 family phage prohead protease